MTFTRNKPVNQFTLDGTFIKRYDSVSIAEKEIGTRNVSQTCKGKRNTAGGYIELHNKPVNPGVLIW